MPGGRIGPAVVSCHVVVQTAFRRDLVHIVEERVGNAGRDIGPGLRSRGLIGIRWLGRVRLGNFSLLLAAFVAAAGPVPAAAYPFPSHHPACPAASPAPNPAMACRAAAASAACPVTAASRTVLARPRLANPAAGCRTAASAAFAASASAGSAAPSIAAAAARCSSAFARSGHAGRKHRLHPEAACLGLGIHRASRPPLRLAAVKFHACD